MENSTSLNIILSSIEDNSLETANSTKSEQNDKTIISTSSETQSLKLLALEVDNFQEYSDRICQNWLKAYERESLCDKNVRQYTKIVILLQDIVELIQKIETIIKCAQLQKSDISQKVGNIISNCLDIELEQVTPTANLAKDLGIDSLSWQELLITIEETFAIRISDEIAGTLTTVKQLTDYVLSIVESENRLSPQLEF